MREGGRVFLYLTYGGLISGEGGEIEFYRR